MEATREYMVVYDRKRHHDDEGLKFLFLTDTQVENLSEVATVVSLDYIKGDITTEYHHGRARKRLLSRSQVMEAKRRYYWRGKREGWLS